jgi:hypothetical protein
MAAVAIAAVILGTYVHIHHRSERFRHLAALHAGKAQHAADIAWGIRRFAFANGGTASPQAKARSDRYWNRYLYHKALRAKYDRASARPWLSVPPEPPAPF